MSSQISCANFHHYRKLKWSERGLYDKVSNFLLRTQKCTLQNLWQYCCIVSSQKGNLHFEAQKTCIMPENYY